MSRSRNSNTIAAFALIRVTATTYRFSCRTCRNVVEPIVSTGDRTSAFEMTCMRKASAIERFRSCR